MTTDPDGDPTAGPSHWVPPDHRGSTSPDGCSRASVRILLFVGIAFLWLSGLVIVFLNTWGDCFGSTDVCEHAWDLAVQRRIGMAVIVLTLTFVGLIALATVGWRSLLVLGLLSLVTGALAIVGDSDPYAIPYVPGGLVGIVPALLLFIIAAVTGIGMRRVDARSP